MTYKVNNKRVRQGSVQMRIYPRKNSRIKKCRGYKRKLLGVMLSVQYRITTLYLSSNINDRVLNSILFNLESKFRTKVLYDVLNKNIDIKFYQIKSTINYECRTGSFVLDIHDMSGNKLKFDILDLDKGFESITVPKSELVISNLNGRWKSYWNLLGINTNL